MYKRSLIAETTSGAQVNARLDSQLLTGLHLCYYSKLKPLQVGNSPWTPSQRPPPLLWPAIADSPPPTCFATTSPPRWAPLLPMPQIGTLTSGASSLAPSSPATHRWSASEPRDGGEWGTSPVSAERAKRPKLSKLFSPAGPSANAGVAHCDSAIFLLSLELFRIQFKFSLNL
jgi:hypothetical protein